ncbi:MAG: hypothetical protein ACOCRO_07780 [Halanaerobiales bacterium]
MERIKKIAQVLRRSGDLIVKKRKDNEWIVSDTHIALFISNKEYQRFKSKWNSYKSNTVLPDNIKEYTTVGGGRESSPDFEKIIPKIKKEIELKDTMFSYKEQRIFKSKENHIVLLDKDYIPLISDDWTAHTDSMDDEKIHFKPVVFKEDQDLKAIVMPQVARSYTTPKELVECELDCKFN